jgi:hypothetical protein
MVATTEKEDNMKVQTIVAAAAALALIGRATEATLVIFTAVDPSAGPGMPFPDSAAKAAAFEAADAGNRTQVRLETAPVGTSADRFQSVLVAARGNDAIERRHEFVVDCDGYALHPGPAIV